MSTDVIGYADNVCECDDCAICAPVENSKLVMTLEIAIESYGLASVLGTLAEICSQRSHWDH